MSRRAFRLSDRVSVDGYGAGVVTRTMRSGPTCNAWFTLDARPADLPMPFPADDPTRSRNVLVHHGDCFCGGTGDVNALPYRDGAGVR